MTMNDSCFLCGQPAQDRCAACGEVSYCSKFHLSKHRPGNTCLPFTIARCPDKGRYVVATRDIEPLEVIIEDQAASLGPKQLTRPVCLSCLAPVSGEYACESCNYPFCSSGCAQADLHADNECTVFPRFPLMKDFSVTQPQYECIAPLRLLLLKQADPQLWKLVRLHKDHSADRAAMDPFLIQGESCKVTGLLLEYCGLRSAGYSEEDVSFVSAVLATHAVTLGTAGRAFYPVFAFMSHSCTYNARHVIDAENTIRVYAQSPIKKGEEVTITYTSLLSCTAKRQDKLRSLWFFSCGCSRCVDPTELGTFISSVVCPSCPDRGYLILKGEMWECTKCRLTVPDTMVDSLLQVTGARMKSGSDGIEELEEFINYASPLLHPNNYQVLITERLLSQLYCPEPPHTTKEEVSKEGGAEEEVSKEGGAERHPLKHILRKIELCQHLLSMISVLDRGCSQFRGLTLYDLFRGQYLLLLQSGSAGLADNKERNRLTEILREAVKCLQVERPDSHYGRVCSKAKDWLTRLSSY